VRRLEAVVHRALGAGVAVLMAAAVVNVSWQVASRFLLGSPSSFTDELARYLLVWIGLLGGAYAAGERRHIAVDLVPASLDAKVGRALALFMHAAVMLFALAVMVGGGARLVWLSFELGQTTAALGMPLGVVYTVVPLVGVLVAFYAACGMLDARQPGGET
jgi:TRAP-type C4-dicarboxylate transport system permease small subunit